MLAAPLALTPLATGQAASPDRYFLMQSLQGTYPGWLLDGNRTQITGWTELSFTAASVHGSNLPMGFNFRANEALLQQNWVRFERSVVTSGTTAPTWGFRIDAILPGADYRFTLPRGLLNDQLDNGHGVPQKYGIDPVQFYGEWQFPTVGRGLDVKVGRLFAIYGAEAIDTVSNQLASHAYTFIYNPFTHTGAVAALKLNDAWTVAAAMTAGSDVFLDPASRPTFTGNVKWAPPGGRDAVTLAAILGPGRFDAAENFNNPNIVDLVWAHTVNARLTATLEGLVGWEFDVPDVGTATWQGLVQYVTWQFSPRLSGTGRLELFHDADGNRTGFRGLYSTATLGLNFKPTRAVIFRPEVRYDVNNRSRPFEGRHGLFTAAFDMVLRW